ncbi:hypothetical protein GCM10025876_14080 [Demequina litorisediminis]|uniref:Uncharacterized protein n=1 Tax=Demequina litorisediminis TaxID=1849022 RepID=A0ABQ6IEP8_9MICO|nr:hypothetical protein GCM10025876_14080 [Demequina litorisediminis]
MIPRATLLRVPWNESLARHQDWDLLIRLDAVGVPIHTVPEVLVSVFQGSQGSISRAGDWEQSLAWADAVGATASRRAHGDFVASIVLRSALRARDFRGVGHAMRRTVELRPHTAAVAVGLGGLVG